jgi:hypothetical protein
LKGTMARQPDLYVSGDATFYNLAYERLEYPRDKWEFERTVRELSSINFCAERVLEGRWVRLFP